MPKCRNKGLLNILRNSIDIDKGKMLLKINSGLIAALNKMVSFALGNVNVKIY